MRGRRGIPYRDESSIMPSVARIKGLSRIKGQSSLHHMSGKSDYEQYIYLIHPPSILVMYGYSSVRKSGGCPLYTPYTPPRHGKNPRLMPWVNK